MKRNTSKWLNIVTSIIPITHHQPLLSLSFKRHMSLRNPRREFLRKEKFQTPHGSTDVNYYKYEDGEYSRNMTLKNKDGTTRTIKLKGEEYGPLTAIRLNPQLAARLKPSIPEEFRVPKRFQIIMLAKDSRLEHFVKLKESRLHRYTTRSCIVQGTKQIREHLNKGGKIKILGVTCPHPKKVTYLSPQGEALEVIKNYEQDWPASEYYLCSIHATRRVLGTASKPADDEIWAEINLPQKEIPGLRSLIGILDTQWNQVKPLTSEMIHGKMNLAINKGETIPKKLVYLHNINDPGNVGNIMRTARALGFEGFAQCPSTADIFSEKVVRASRGAIVGYPLAVVWPRDMMTYIKTLNQMIPKCHVIVGDMLPKDLQNQLGNKNKHEIVYWKYQEKEQECQDIKEQIQEEQIQEKEIQMNQDKVEAKEQGNEQNMEQDMEQDEEENKERNKLFKPRQKWPYGENDEKIILNRKELPKSYTLILGSDHHGITMDLKNKLPIDRTIFASIPMQEDFDSLNVASAASILMYDLLCLDPSPIALKKEIEKDIEKDISN